MGSLVSIKVTILGEYFHTRRRQRDCILYVFFNVSLQAYRKGESHVTPGAWKWPMSSLLPLFVARLAESLVTLGAGKWSISCMVPLMFLQATRSGETMSHSEPTKG